MEIKKNRRTHGKRWKIRQNRETKVNKITSKVKTTIQQKKQNYILIHIDELINIETPTQKKKEQQQY